MDEDYAEKILRERCDAIRGATVGNRNQALFTAGLVLGHYVDRLGYERIVESLTQASLDAGLEPRSIRDSLKSGLRRTEGDPREAKTLTDESIYYVYDDEDGTPLFRVQRRPGKGFAQQRFVDGDWAWGIEGVRRVLFNLPAVVKAAANAETVWIVEGEKDAGTLIGRDVIATTAPHGAGKWRDEYSKTLLGAKLIIVPDYDVPGLEHAEQVYESLIAAGVCEAHLMLLFPKEVGHDATDHFEAGYDFSDFVGMSLDQLRQRLAELKVKRREGIISATELLAEDFPEQKWAVEGLIGEGVTLLFSAPKARKSFLSLDIAASISCGRDVMDKYPTRQGSVLYLALEDSKRRVKHRLTKILGADQPGPLWIFPLDAGAWPPLDEGGDEQIVDWCQATPDARLVIIDVFEKVRGSNGRSGSVYRDDYDAIRPLSYVASVTGVPVVAVHHTNKGTFEDPFAALSGSNGLRGAIDNLIYLQRKEDNGVLLIQGRDLEEAKVPINWDQDHLRWRVSDVDPEELQYQEIVDLLAAKGMMWEKTIFAFVEGDEQEVRHKLLRMEDRGMIKSEKQGGAKHYYLAP